MDEANITSIDDVIDSSMNPIGLMNKFVKENDSGQVSDLVINELSNVFNKFLDELKTTELSKKDRKRDLGNLFVKHFEGSLKVGSHNLSWDVKMRVEIDAVIYYKVNYKKELMNSKLVKDDIVKLFYPKYRILGNIKSFENCLSHWSDHVDSLLSNSESYSFHVRNMKNRLGLSF
ncbi:hypothetical protein [Thalassotalea sp. SU-HH00458]|uniref:hypothetical protein n=1 Tax=Thalassotalea sp. SU-HH00458 TaxID=3127657 RepID=UPI003109B166